jgi:hypothetical protein
MSVFQDGSFTIALLSALTNSPRPERQIGVLLGQQDRHAFRIKTPDCLEYFLHDLRVKASMVHPAEEGAAAPVSRSI